VVVEPEFVFDEESLEPEEFVEPVDLVVPVGLPELLALPLAEVTAAAVEPFVLPVPLPPPPQAANRLQAATIAAARIQRCATRRPY
jgi:hypothetical protein